MKKHLWKIAGGVVILFYIWTVCLGNDLLQPSIASKILRFHVVANSDSEADQAVKEAVRDAVGAYLQPLLEGSESIAETKLIVEEQMDKIIEVATATLRENNFDYEVNAHITTTYFPEKTYGSYTFPKGRYQALQITIGEGKGQNWWCVLYPNMCFRGAVYEVVDEDAKEALQEVLTPWEYADVFESDELELRFKFLEYFVGNE